MPEEIPYKDIRPWGEEVWLNKDKPSMVKIISVKPDSALSLQYHHNRDEFWYVISGSGQAQIGDEMRSIKTSENVFVKRGEKHRIISGHDGLIFLELAYGDFDENDIVRIEDRYGRAS